jgi:flagellin
MGIVVNTNTAAMQTATLLSQSNSALQQSLMRLSSGNQITSPGQDSAGYAVSLSLVSQQGENTAASNNIADAISYSQTQNGYLTQVTSALDRMSELSVQAQDVTKSTADKSLYQQEFSTLASYVSNVSTESFNGVSLFNGTTLGVTIDSNGGNFNMLGIDLTSSTFSSLSTQSLVTGASAAETAVNNAITQVGVLSASLGASQETLNNYSGQLATLNNNLAAANSAIMDVNVATESSNYAKENILAQTGTAMLAQANAIPQIALKLIG